MTVISPKSVFNLVYMKDRPTIDGVQKSGKVLAARPDQSNLSSAQIANRNKFGQRGRDNAAKCGIEKGMTHPQLKESMSCLRTGVIPSHAK